MMEIFNSQYSIDKELTLLDILEFTRKQEADKYLGIQYTSVIIQVHGIHVGHPNRLCFFAIQCAICYCYAERNSCQFSVVAFAVNYWCQFKCYEIKDQFIEIWDWWDSTSNN